MDLHTERVSRIADAFRERFGINPGAVVRAPGRVEIIGGHTDYNEGYVMPAAIDRDVLIAAARNSGKTVHAHSLNFNQTREFSLDAIEKSEDALWLNYVMGTMQQLLAKNVDLTGMYLAIEGNVPLGGGLSSSAALEVATAWAALEISHQSLPPEEIAKLCQRAENQFVGVNSGIMDQFISALGEEGKAMFLDCRSLDYQSVKLPEHTKIVVADSKKPRTLAGSEYNIRRAQCEEAVEILKKHIPDVKALRDIAPEDLEKYSSKLPEVVRKRARHVVHENERVLKCVRALNRGDRAEFGEMLNQSHASARDLYEISIPELNVLQEAAVSVDGCLGSRLSGAGFGGCTVSIVESDAVETFRETVVRQYKEKTGITPDVDVLSSAGGASRVL